jgi:predicted component of type VI protein secretion system
MRAKYLKLKFKRVVPRFPYSAPSRAIDGFAVRRHFKGAGHDVGSTVTG